MVFAKIAYGYDFGNLRELRLLWDSVSLLTEAQGLLEQDDRLLAIAIHFISTDQ